MCAMQRLVQVSEHLNLQGVAAAVQDDDLDCSPVIVGVARCVLHPTRGSGACLRPVMYVHAGTTAWQMCATLLPLHNHLLVE